MKSISFILLLLLLSNCDKNSLSDKITPSASLVQPFGTQSTFEMSTWNIEHFPKKGQESVTTLTRLIKELEIDLIAFQEIDNEEYFWIMLDSLPDYNGFCSSYPKDELKLGLIYNQNLISVSNLQQLFIDDTYNFPRPPLYAFIQIKKGNVIAFNFSLINIHLKAFHDSLSILRRKNAVSKLKHLIDIRLLTSSDKDVIILGDWNDDLSDEEDENIFSPFLTDSMNYSFLLPAENPQISYPAWQSRIDHILITNDVKTEYKNGLTEVLQPDTEFDGYFDIISDHRPVAAKFYIFE